jgi:hypothetical protein
MNRACRAAYFETKLDYYANALLSAVLDFSLLIWCYVSLSATFRIFMSRRSG